LGEVIKQVQPPLVLNNQTGEELFFLKIFELNNIFNHDCFKITLDVLEV